MNFLFLNGMLALFQITVLPGLLLLKWIKLAKSTFFQSLVYVFALSLIANFCMVIIFTALKIYTAYMLYLVVLAEIIIIFKLYSSEFKKTTAEVSESIFNKIGWHISSLVETFQRRKIHDPVYALGIIVVSVAFVYLSLDSLLWVFKIFRNNLGDIFHLGDAVLNWNPWATLYWYKQVFPDAYHYGQLIPASWSVIYKFMENTHVQFFATSIMPLFFLFALILMFDRGLESKELHFFIALVFLRYMVKKFAFEIIDDGYVDVALMFFAFLPFFVIIKARDMERNQQERYLLLGSILAGGAGATKQGGLFVLFAFFLLAYVLIIRNSRTTGAHQDLKLLGKMALISCLIALPWYIISEVLLRMSSRMSEFQAINEIVLGDKTYLERLTAGILMVEKYNILYIVSILTVPFLDRIYRWLVLAVIIPYYFIWALFFSYDARNLTLTFPLVSLTAAAGLVQIGYRSEGLIRWLRLSKVKAYIVALILVVLLFFFGAINPVFSDSALVERQISLQKKLFFPQLNEAIYAAVANSDPGTKILSNYRIELLPGLESNAILYKFPNLADYLDKLQGNPDIRLILLSKDVSPDIVNFVLAQINDGNYNLLTEAGNWLLIKIPSGDQ